MKNKSKSLVLAITMTLSILLTSCGYGGDNYNGFVTSDCISNSVGISSSKSSESYYDIDYSEPHNIAYNEFQTSSNEPNNVEITLDADKLVYKASFDIETLEFEQTISELKTMILIHSGAIQNEDYYDSRNWDYYSNSANSNSYGYQNGTITVRIPTSNYKSFVDGLNGSNCHITNKSEYVENITNEYNDTVVLIESKETQLEKLMSMYNSATTITEMLEIEDRITNINTELNQAKTKLKRMDVDVAYSTITINVQSVSQYTLSSAEEENMGFFERLGTNFSRGIKNTGENIKDLIMWISYNFFNLVIVTAAIVVVVVVIKKIHKKQKTKSLKNKAT